MLLPPPHEYAQSISHLDLQLSCCSINFPLHVSCQLHTLFRCIEIWPAFCRRTRMYSQWRIKTMHSTWPGHAPADAGANTLVPMLTVAVPTTTSLTAYSE